MWQTRDFGSCPVWGGRPLSQCCKGAGQGSVGWPCRDKVGATFALLVLGRGKAMAAHTHSLHLRKAAAGQCLLGDVSPLACLNSFMTFFRFLGRTVVSPLPPSQHAMLPVACHGAGPCIISQQAPEQLTAPHPACLQAVLQQLPLAAASALRCRRGPPRRSCAPQPAWGSSCQLVSPDAGSTAMPARESPL